MTLRLSVVDCAPGSSAVPSARCASDPVSINPDSLLAAKNQQNRIAEYRDMLRAWKRIRAVIWAGDIIGFPADTPATAMRDIRIIPHELPIDFLEFFVLTPLPGSEDHQARRPQTIARQTVARGLVYICRNRHLERAADSSEGAGPVTRPPATRPPSDKPTAPPAPRIPDAPTPDARPTTAELPPGRQLLGVWRASAESATSDRHSGGNRAASDSTNRAAVTRAAISPPPRLAPRRPNDAPPIDCPPIDAPPIDDRPIHHPHRPQAQRLPLPNGCPADSCRGFMVTINSPPRLRTHPRAPRRRDRRQTWR